jgi:NDP-sugar pyrophosphorylase family protein
MRPHTDRLPKMLLPVAGEPFAAHQLRWLASEGVHHVVVATGYLGHLIEEFVGDGSAFGLEVSYSTDGPHSLGTGGATRQAVERCGARGAVGVLYGDSYLIVDLGEVVTSYLTGGLPALMVVFENHNEHDASNAAFDGRLVRYEKGRRDPLAAGLHFIDYGLSIFDSDLIIDRIPAGRPSDLSDLQAALSRGRQLAGYVATRRFFEIGSPVGLADLERHLTSRQ